jgi:hypothetical protein
MNPIRIMEAVGKAKLFALITALSCVAAPEVAMAQEEPTDVSRAESFASKAFDAYQKKDYQEAVVLYLKAFEVAPSADVLFNLARIYDTKLNDRELAMSFYRRYIADPGADPQRVRTANTRLAELRELELAARDKPAVVPPVQAQGGNGQAQPYRGNEPNTAPSPAEHHGLSGVQWAGIATGVVGLSGLAVGTVFGLGAKSKADTAKQECDGNDCHSQSGVDAAKDASTKADVATVAFIAGGALTVVGTILLVAGGSSASPERDTASFRIAPYAGPGTLGTQLSGRF